jgi:hypothetical protein
MRNIRYIGTKAVETAFIADTGITWTPGMVETVLSEELAARMLKFTDVFQDAGNAKAATVSAPADLPGGGGALTGTTYANGQMTSYTVGGVTTTLTYDPGTGRLASTTTNSVTKTLTYNPDGTLASYQ